MDVGPFLTLAILWAVLSLVGKIAGSVKKQQQRQGGSTTPPIVRRAEPIPRRQPETFEELLAEMRGQIEGKREAPLPTWETSLLEAEEVEDRRTSDDEIPEVVSLETGWQRAPRIETFSDSDEAQALVQRRIDAAAARDHEWRAADHRGFDAKIRQPVAVAVPARVRPDLQRAMIWREVLGPPISLRPRDPLSRGDG